MTRNHSLAMIAIMSLVPALPALAQVSAVSAHGPRVRPPFTAEFKLTHVQTLANGTTITTESKEVMARDQDLRRMSSTTTEGTGDRPAVTNVHVSDPTTGDEISWNSSTKVARDIRRPVQADRHGCWATPDGHSRMNFGGGSVEASPLEPPAPPQSADAPVATPLAQSDTAPRFPNAVTGPDGQIVTMIRPRSAPGAVTSQPFRTPGNVVHDDLGTDTIMGVEVHGQRTTVTTPAGAEGNDQPLVRTDEMWMAPSLGMVLRSNTDDPRMGKSTREAVSVDLDPPDPALFQPPADYKVDTQVMQPVACAQ